ncbi:MAG: hypothetical protein ACK5IQ_09090 [Bacteroidales bacterium]
MQVLEVRDGKQIELFHKFPHKLYKGDPNWVCQPHALVENVFNPEKNNALRNGVVCRWLLMDDGEVQGRIAAFVVDTYAHSFEQLTGGLGFFECIDNQDAANALFDTAIKWLKDKGMEAVDGPINIGENFFHWGVLSDGFVQPTYGMQYNLPYYEKLFKTYGFETYYEQYSYQLDITSPDLPDRFWRIAERMFNKPGFSYEQFRFAQKKKFIKDFMEIYEQAWTKHGNYKCIDPKDIDEMLKESKHMLDEDFIWFVYKEGRPIAIFMMVPDINQLLKKIPSGKLNLVNILKLMWYRRQKTINRCRVLVMGVVPKYQKSGVESAIFYKIREVLLRKMWYKQMELSWVADFNPKMIAVFKAVGAVYDRTHKTLRYLFDRTKEFKRAEVMED